MLLEAEEVVPAWMTPERPGPEPRGVRPTARVWRQIWRPCVAAGGRTRPCGLAEEDRPGNLSEVGL